MLRWSVPLSGQYLVGQYMNYITAIKTKSFKSF